MKNKKYIKVIISVLLVFTFFAMFMGHIIFSYAFVKDSFFSRDSINAMLNNNAQNVSTDSKRKTWLELNSNDVYIYSDDELKLHALYAENGSSDHRYAIICHGYLSCAVNTSYFAKSFYDMGFSVLAPDARAHGESEGNITGMGYIEKGDLINWINLIKEKDPYAEVLLFGLSMGASTVLFATGEENLPSCVKCAISDSAFSCIYDEIKNTVNSYIPYIRVDPYVGSASLICKLKSGFFFSEADCVEAVKKSKTPTLFIHGSNDTLVQFSMLDKLYMNAQCEKSVLIVSGATHTLSATQNPDEYWGKVQKFIKDKI